MNNQNCEPKIVCDRAISDSYKLTAQLEGIYTALYEANGCLYGTKTKLVGAEPCCETVGDNDRECSVKNSVDLIYNLAIENLNLIRAINEGV